MLFDFANTMAGFGFLDFGTGTVGEGEPPPTTGDAGDDTRRVTAALKWRLKHL
jgi:hypothetical protein